MKRNYNVDDAIDFVFDGKQSDLSGLSSDEEENNEIEDIVRNNVSNDEPTDAAESDDDIPLAFLAGESNQTSSNDQVQANNEPAEFISMEKERYGCLWSFVSWRIFWTTFRRYGTSAILFDVYYNSIVRYCCITFIVFKLFINPSIQTVQK